MQESEYREETSSSTEVCSVRNYRTVFKRSVLVLARTRPADLLALERQGIYLSMCDNKEQYCRATKTPKREARTTLIIS